MALIISVFSITENNKSLLPGEHLIIYPAKKLRANFREIVSGSHIRMEEEQKREKKERELFDTKHNTCRVDGIRPGYAHPIIYPLNCREMLTVKCYVISSESQRFSYESQSRRMARGILCYAPRINVGHGVIFRKVVKSIAKMNKLRSDDL